MSLKKCQASLGHLEIQFNLTRLYYFHARRPHPQLKLSMSHPVHLKCGVRGKCHSRGPGRAILAQLTFLPSIHHNDGNTTAHTSHKCKVGTNSDNLSHLRLRAPIYRRWDFGLHSPSLDCPWKPSDICYLSEHHRMCSPEFPSIVIQGIDS